MNFSVKIVRKLSLFYPLLRYIVYTLKLYNIYTFISEWEPGALRNGIALLSIIPFNCYPGCFFLCKTCVPISDKWHLWFDTTVVQRIWYHKCLRSTRPPWQCRLSMLTLPSSSLHTFSNRLWFVIGFPVGSLTHKNNFNYYNSIVSKRQLTISDHTSLWHHMNIIWENFWWPVTGVLDPQLTFCTTVYVVWPLLLLLLLIKCE